MRILITGSRDWTDAYAIENAIIHALNTSSDDTPVTIIHGNASGADRIADRIAKKYQFEIEIHLPDWDKNKKSAGILRNKKMVDSGADCCLAFIRNGSKGATHCSNAAMKAGIPTTVYRIDEVDEW